MAVRCYDWKVLPEWEHQNNNFRSQKQHFGKSFRQEEATKICTKTATSWFRFFFRISINSSQIYSKKEQFQMSPLFHRLQINVIASVNFNQNESRAVRVRINHLNIHGVVIKLDKRWLLSWLECRLTEVRAASTSESVAKVARATCRFGIFTLLHW